MINKVKELRQIAPVPISEAMHLLKESDGDVELCVEKFKVKSIAHLCEITGCDMDTVRNYYLDEKLDFNRTLSAINNYIYDLNYQPIEGLTSEKIRQAIQWINFGEDKDFAASLYFKYLDAVLDTLSLIPILAKYGKITEKVKLTHNSIFDGYTDDMPLEEFVRRHKKLDDDPDFEEANNLFLLSKTVYKDELLKHLRNIEKQ